MKIQLKIFSIIFTVILITGIIVIILSAVISKNILATEVYNHLEDVAVSRVKNIRTLLNEEIELIKILATDQAFIQAVMTDNTAPAVQRINTLIEVYDNISQVNILDKNGKILASSHPDIDPIIEELTINTDVHIKDIHFSKLTNTNVFSIFSPISVNNNLAGIISIDINASEGLYEITTDRTGLGKTGEIYLINRDGYMITPSRFLDDTFLKLKVDSPEAKEWLKLSKEEEEIEHNEVDSYKNYQGKMVIGTHRQIGDWCLLAEISLEEAFAPVTKLVQIMTFFLTLLLTLSSIAAFLIARNLIYPIIQLQRKIAEIERGNWNYQIDITTKDEIGQLSILFNRMITKIKNTQDQLHNHRNELEAQVLDRTVELRQKIFEIEQQKLGIQTLVLNLETNRHRYENLVNSIDGIVWEADVETFQFTFVSKQAEHLVGFPLADWLTPNFWIEHIHPDDRQNIMYHREKVIFHQKNSISEYRLITKRNFNIWVKDSVHVEIENGQVVKLYGVMFDITANKRLEFALQNFSNKLEHKVKERTKELYASNEQLQEEIIERRQIEEELTKYHDDLEKLVTERTLKLNQINQQLQAEIIERKHIQEALQESDEKNRLLLDSAPEAIYGLDLQGNCTFCNPACVKLLGYASADDLINQNIHNLTHHTKIDGSQYLIEECNIHKSFRNGEGVHVDTEILWRADNTSFPAEYWSYPIFKHGKAIGLVVTFVDITERKQTEKTLQESEARFRSLFEGMPDAIIIADPISGIIIDSNPAASRLLLKSRDEIVGLHQSKLHPPEITELNQKKFKQAAKQIRETGRSSLVEDAVIRSDGRKIPVEILANVIYIQGKPRIQGVFRDVTERMKAKEKLQNSEAWFRKMFEEGPIGMVITDAKLNFTRANTAFCQMLGYTEAELRQKNVKDITHPDDMDTNAKLVQKAKNGKISFYQMEKRYIRKDGKAICGNLAASVFHNDKDEVTYFLAKIEDITERKKVEIALKTARDAANAANQAKSEFLANMSHEIRTPMNAVIGFSDILAAQITDIKQKSYLESIQTAGKNLLNLINDILDLSKIEAGRFEIHYEPVNLLAIFNELQQIFVLKIAEKNLNFIVDIDAELPATLMLDEIRLRQILLNLIGNAIKFTDSGYIKLNAKQTYLESNQLELIITIEDSGIGIPADQQEIIFESFRQQDGQSTRKYGGTGLGLAISKRLVEMMDGQISVTSIPGTGSNFSIILPRVKIAITAPSIPLPFQQYHLDTLVITSTINAELKTKIIQEIIPLITEINAVMEMDMVSECAEKLIGLGEEYNISAFVQHGEQLLEYTQTFNIAEIQKILKELSTESLIGV